MTLYYKREEICAIADEVRTKYCDNNDAPVDVEVLWESMGGEIRPGKGLGVNGTEAMLYGGFKVILVDYDKFLNDSYYNRIRFSIAHEIGHYFLHCRGNPKFSNPEEFYAYYKNLDDDQYNWYEWHANEFAGRLLVPIHELNKSVVEGWDNLVSTLSQNADMTVIRSDDAVDLFAKRINARFQVSADCIGRRLRAEKLWPPENFGR